MLAESLAELDPPGASHQSQFHLADDAERVGQQVDAGLCAPVASGLRALRKNLDDRLAADNAIGAEAADDVRDQVDFALALALACVR